MTEQESDTDSGPCCAVNGVRDKADKKSKWQQGLLSSGLILEHAVARSMTELGALVVSEYSYSRMDGDVLKECSCDVLVDALLPMADEDKIEAVLVVPIECKHRAEKKIWLFTPDTNRADCSQGVIASVRSFPEFTPFEFPRTALYEVMRRIPLGVKGMEIHLGSGETFDKEIKTGVNQLRYAMPSILESHIQGNAGGHFENAVPFFVCPILCTNAPLYMLKEDVSFEDVAKAHDIDAIAEKASVVDLYSNFGVDFEKHCAAQTQRLMPLIGKTDERNEIYAKIHENAPKRSPWSTIISLTHGLVTAHDGLFSQFLVCQFDHLPTLVKELEAAILEDMKAKSFKEPWKDMAVSRVSAKDGGS